YGLAEATLLASGTVRGVEPRQQSFERDALESGRALPLPLEQPGARRLVSLGKSPADGALLIVEPDTAQPVAAGQIGEIWLKSGSVARGYWNNPALSEAVFGARLQSGEGPFLRTGDLGFIERDELFFAGRSKEIIIVRGRKHYPQDIEQAIEGA